MARAAAGPNKTGVGSGRAVAQPAVGPAPEAGSREAEGRDILHALDVLVNGAIPVLRDTAFDVRVRIDGPCIIQDCGFPHGLEIAPGGSVTFKGTSTITMGGKTFTIKDGAAWAVPGGGPDAVLA